MCSAKKKVVREGNLKVSIREALLRIYPISSAAAANVYEHTFMDPDPVAATV